MGSSTTFGPSRARRLRFGFLSLVAALVLGCGVAYLEASGVVSTSISGGSALAGGASWDVVPVANSVAYQGGRAVTLTGVGLYRIDIANSANRNRIRVNLAWVDPHDAAKALHNPHAFLLLGLYHQVGPLSRGKRCAAGGIYVDDPVNGGLCFAIDESEASEAALARQSADAFLVASIVAGKGDYAPAGQQGQLESLSFYASAQMGGQ